MLKKEKGQRCTRRPFKKSSKADRANPRKAQSPWRNAIEYDPLANAIERTRADLDRLGATSEDDRRYFETHPERDFYLRNSTPHEVFTGLSRGWVLVCQIEPGLRMRLPVDVFLHGNIVERAYETVDARIYDNEERAAKAFDWLTRHYTAANTHPAPYALVEKLRQKRRAAGEVTPHKSKSTQGQRRTK
jgi:hypothetical protein